MAPTGGGIGETLCCVAPIGGGTGETRCCTGTGGSTWLGWLGENPNGLGLMLKFLSRTDEAGPAFALLPKAGETDLNPLTGVSIAGGGAWLIISDC